MSSKAYFDKVADQWDEMREDFFPKDVREKALAAAGVKAGESAADIGAGSGFLSEALLREGLHVIAVDQSEAMLNMMRRKFSAAGSIDYRAGEASSLPIADEAVDHAFANMYLHHVESPPVAIKEMARILKPGGKLVITDMDKHEYEFLNTEHHDRWMGFEREDIHQWFEEAGLQNVTVDCVDETCCADSSSGTEQAIVSIFIAHGRRIDPSPWESFWTPVQFLISAHA
ncbi:MAG: class I SAM-dependent methyltransferase [Anaerolineales bacterium]